MEGGLPARDDRVLAPTRWVSRGIVPILVSAFVLLYGFPGRTTELWAWTIRPEMTAAFMGAGYLAGSYFFVQAARARQWHRLSAGFVTITVFASMLLGATILHWDRFNHDHLSFWLWLGLYVTTPPLLPWLWATNRRTDPGAAAGDVMVPPGLRRAVGAGGAATLAFTGFLYAFPERVVGSWPWALTPLTARTLASFTAVAGLAWLWFLVDARWTALRLLQQVATAAFVLILLASVLNHGSFRPGRFVPYVAGLVVALGLTVALQVAMERRSRRLARAPA